VNTTFARDRDPASFAHNRNESRDQTKVDIRGRLKCPMPESNTGRACTLEIVSAETGESLRVAGSNTAMRLFQSGQTQVVATGNIMGDSLRIIEIRPE
jgi:hypothetical protein